MTEPEGGTPRPALDEIEDEIARLERRLAELRTRLAERPGDWWPQRFYASYHIVVGSLLGLLAAGASLLFNVVGSLMADLHPLEIVRVYLTFPLGARALEMEDGLALSTGVLLYLATGMLFGAVLHGVGQKRFPAAPLLQRLVLATAAGLGLWLVNFYGLLSWIQPLVSGGDWIVSEIPALVGAATHVVFTWTLTLLAFLGRFEPPAGAPADEPRPG